MARGRPKKAYTNGDITLGWRGAVAVAEFSDEGTGQRKRVALTTKDAIITEEQAKQLLDQFAEARRAVKKQQARYTIRQLWDLWLADRAEDGYNNAIYRANWVSLAPVFASRDPELITIADSRAYARARFDAGRRPATVHTELIRLRHCMKWAAKRRLIPFAPDIWVPAKGKPRNRVLSAEDAKRLLDAAGDPHIELFIILAISTGARHMAILDLTWDRIDWARGLIQYDEDLPPDPMHKSWRKGRATVPMNALARAALTRAYAGRQTDHVIEHGGRRLVTVKNGFANAVRRAGIDSAATPHTLRHSVSTWLKERGVDLEKRAQLLGHADSKTTDLNYSHADAATYLTDAVDMLDESMKPLSHPSSAHQPMTISVHNGQKPQQKARSGKGRADRLSD